MAEIKITELPAAGTLDPALDTSRGPTGTAVRDVLMVVGARLVVPRGYEFSVSTLGKLATWVLYTGAAMTMITVRGSQSARGSARMRW